MLVFKSCLFVVAVIAATLAVPLPAAPADVQKQNGKEAEQNSAADAKLNADSSCTPGQEACIDGGFAQCVGTKFVITPCNGGLICKQLPLVNKAGTSIACTTEQDAAARLQAAANAGKVN